MRTGSTWVFDTLAHLLRPSVVRFVSDATEAAQTAAAAESCLLKSHSLIDLDLPVLRSELHVTRILRNYKDSLISRALYCRHVRRTEGYANEPEVQSLIDAAIGLSDRAFVNDFLINCTAIPAWMEDLVVFERGDYDSTFYFEMLHYNPRDQFANWLAARGEPADRLDHVLEECSFATMRNKKTPGFIGSTGIGQWLHFLHQPVSQALDRMYLAQREIVEGKRCERYPVTHRSSGVVPE